MIGLAREVATKYGTTLRDTRSRPISARPTPRKPGRSTVTIEDAVALPALLRRAGRRHDRPVAGLARRSSDRRRHPLDQQHRRHHQLRAARAGASAARVRPVAKLEGPELRIRTARPGEALTTLDGQKRTLDPEMLVIADKSRAQALAGVMGGGDSEVSGDDRGRSRSKARGSCRRRFGGPRKRLGLSTEASYRFERGADFAATSEALARACALIAQVGAGTIRPGWIDACPAVQHTDDRAASTRRERRKSSAPLSRLDEMRRILTGTRVPDRREERVELGRCPSHRGASTSPATSI